MSTVVSAKPLARRRSGPQGIFLLHRQRSRAVSTNYCPSLIPVFLLLECLAYTCLFWMIKVIHKSKMCAIVRELCNSESI